MLKCQTAWPCAQEEGSYLEAVRRGLRDLGYAEGEPLKLDSRSPSDCRNMAAGLVALKPDALLIAGASAAMALERAQRP